MIRVPPVKKANFYRVLRQVLQGGFTAEPYYSCGWSGQLVFFVFEAASDVVRRNISARDAKVEPFLERKVKTHPVHVVKQRLLKTVAKLLMINARRVSEIHVVVREGYFIVVRCYAVAVRVEADGAVGR
jgi:hypothetical protein